jgi:hypothetical protein
VRKIASSYIFPVTQPPIKNGILFCDDDGVIQDIFDPKSNFKEKAGLEFYSGILIPGFVSVFNVKSVCNQLFDSNSFSLSDFKNEVFCQHLNQKISVVSSSDRKLWAAGLVAYNENHSQVSVIQEMLFLQKKFPEVKLEDLIAFFTLKIAKEMHIDDCFGSFEKGKMPGVNLISGVDFQNMKLTTNTRVKRLI